MAAILQDPPANDQEMAQMEVDIHGLIKAILEAFPTEVSWSKVELCS